MANSDMAPNCFRWLGNAYLPLVPGDSKMGMLFLSDLGLGV